MDRPMRRKILTLQISEEIYDLLITRGLFPEEQKKYCKWRKDAGEIPYTEQHSHKDSQMSWNNLDMAWIDNKNG